ncbi:MAG: glycosyltransferase family 9 protein [Ferruginibacter sp.]
MKIPENVLISRIDSIGDVVLALPVAGELKKNFPGIKIGLVGALYTKPVIEACEHIDTFIDVSDFIEKEIFIDGMKPQSIIHLVTNPGMSKRAAELRIPIRIGTMSRLFHWKYCNKLVWLSRTLEGFHEIDGNLKLLKPFGLNKKYSFTEMAALYGLTRFKKLSTELSVLIDKNKFNIILHPKSKGNSREWPLIRFTELINSLDEKLYNIFITGVESEKIFVQQISDAVNRPVHNMSGKISLEQFIPFISATDGIVSNSTGPLHIAAALGKNALGIYPSLKGKDPARWGPVGFRAQAFAIKKDCLDCKDTKDQCACISSISAFTVKEALDKLAK